MESCEGRLGIGWGRGWGRRERKDGWEMDG